MANIHISDGPTVLRKSTKRLAKQAKRASRELKHSAMRAADETARQARDVSRATWRSMRKHPIAWTSTAAALAAAAITGVVLARRSAQ